MLDRRAFTIGVLTLMAAAGSAHADELNLEQLVQRAIDDQDKEVTLGRRILPPNDPAWREAYRILQAAPTNVPPYEVAEYFKTSVPPRFQQAWPEADANPIIVEFFWDMHDKPAGDTTPWCSAFVNWCLRRAGIAGTNDAGSQSFVNKNWGQEIWKKGDGLPRVARRGDVAVFRHQSDPAHGHVAFFEQLSSSQPNRIDVLGGNQIKRSGGVRVHLIDHQSMRIDSDLELFSIRTLEGLRSA